MENNIKVTFWLSMAKKNSLNLVPVYLRVWYNYEHFTKTTKLYVKVSDWDKKAQRVKGNTEIVNTTQDTIKCLLSSF